MTKSKLELPAAAAPAAAVPRPASAGEKPAIQDLVARLRSEDDRVRGEAWQGAGPHGAAAVRPVAAIMTDPDFQIARAAKRAVWKIVRHCGRPGAPAERTAVVTELDAVLAATDSAAVRREVLWMLSEIGGDGSVPGIANLLADKTSREDARMTLERIPGKASLAALREGLKAAPDDFKTNLAQSLRARGEEVPGLPCEKLVPTHKTIVEPVQ